MKYHCNGCNEEWDSAIYVCPRCGSYAVVKIEAPVEVLRYYKELESWHKYVSKYLKPKEEQIQETFWGIT
jgi:DNA-directed RNA polymerase subunit RPC12/RpoP